MPGTGQSRWSIPGAYPLMQTGGFRAVGHALRGVPRSASEPVVLHIPRNATEGVPYSAQLRICTRLVIRASSFIRHSSFVICSAEILQTANP